MTHLTDLQKIYITGAAVTNLILTMKKEDRDQYNTGKGEDAAVIPGFTFTIDDLHGICDEIALELIGKLSEAE